MKVVIELGIGSSENGMNEKNGIWKSPLDPTFQPATNDESGTDEMRRILPYLASNFS